MPEVSPFPPADISKAGFTISTNPDLLDVARIHSYLSEQSYWARGRSRDRVERSIRHSLCFAVYAAEAHPPLQVGFARVVTDYATFAYLADVFILPDYQGHGLGKWLVETILEHPELRLVSRWTLYTKDAQELYRRYGFNAEKDPQTFMSYRPQESNSVPPG